MTRVLSAIYCLSAIASILSYSPSALALEATEISAIAKEFTVKIDGEDTGTGTIIENNNGTYTVLTCWHVMETTGDYKITTADGATYQVIKIDNLPGVDLAIVTFSSSNTYPVAELGDSATAEPQLDIHVVGYNAPFPGLTTREYLPDSGKVRVRKETDENGYEIIHSVTVTPGSSGGGIFDNEARLIGVNGEVFSEGNTGKAYGKGIPLEIYLEEQDNFVTVTDDAESQDLANLALEPSAIYAKAKEFTVQIDGEETGTGTIIENNNGTYTVLTCWHVMDTPGSYQITTADGSTHQATKIENLPDVDLATVTFSSSNTYPVAELGDSATAIPGLNIYVVGYSAPFVGLDERLYLTESAEVQGRLKSADENGYQIIHSGTLPSGSSGGGIFNNEASLIGVNGRVFSDGNTGKAYGMGIPLEIYLAAQDSFEAFSNTNTSADFFNAGNNQFIQRDYDLAIADFDEAIRLDPQDVDAYYRRGLSYKNIGNSSSAIRDLKQSAELYRQQENTKSYLKAIIQIEQLR